MSTMDTFTQEHLAKWADAVLFDDEKDAAVRQITAFAEAHPDVLERYDWPTIKMLAERGGK